MANELQHKTVGTTLTQAEWEAVDGHALDGQSVGDLIYAADGSILRRLAVGSTGQFLGVTAGVPSWQAVTTEGLSASGQTAGDLLAYQSGEWSRLPLGSEGQVVGNNGGSLEYVDPRQAGDDVGYVFGTDTDARWIYDSSNNELWLQTRDAVGAWATRLTIPANIAQGVMRLPAGNGWLAMPNNHSLLARNAANTTDVSIIRLNASNAVEITEPLFNSNTTDATSAAAAALITAGGLAVAKDLYAGGMIHPIASLKDATAPSAQMSGAGLSSMGRYQVADDGLLKLFGSGSTSPSGPFFGIVAIYASSYTNSNPVSGEQANFALFFAQTGANNNSAGYQTIVAGANVQIVTKNGADSALSDITDGKLGIVVGGGTAANRYLHVYNRLGGVREIFPLALAFDSRK